MKDFFKDIFQYHHHYNQKVLDQLMENESQLPEKTIPLFSHMVNAHCIWNSRLTNIPGVNLNEVRTLQECKLMDTDNSAVTLNILESCNFKEVVEYKTSRGDAYSNTVQEILFHLANHTTHHRGQIVAQLRGIGVEPIITDYIFYKR